MSSTSIRLSRITIQKWRFRNSRYFESYRVTNPSEALVFLYSSNSNRKKISYRTYELWCFSSNYIFRLSGHHHKVKTFHGFEIVQEMKIFVHSCTRVQLSTMSTWAVLNGESEGTDSRFRIGVFIGDVARHVYVCTHVARPSGPARKNWSAFYNGTWFTWFDETITATCTASIENIVSQRCRGAHSIQREGKLSAKIFQKL